MRTRNIIYFAITVALATTSCSLSQMSTSKLVKKTATKVATKAVYGNYNWASDNLNVSTFRNGDAIPQVKSNEEWEKAGKEGKPAWCYYKNDPQNDKKYGKLYNWHAVSDPRGLAPEGYRIPTGQDIKRLIESTGHGAANAVTKELLKGGNTGYNSKLAGERDESGSFTNINKQARYWTSDKSNDTRAVSLYVAGKYNMSGDSDFVFGQGFSVRCIKE